MNRTSRTRARLIRIAAALGLAAALGGCIIAPIGPGYYHHPYRGYYY